MDQRKAQEQELPMSPQAIEGLTIYGSQDLAQRSGVISISKTHPHDWQQH